MNNFKISEIRATLSLTYNYKLRSSWYKKYWIELPNGQNGENQDQGRQRETSRGTPQNVRWYHKMWKI